MARVRDKLRFLAEVVFCCEDEKGSRKTLENNAFQARATLGWNFRIIRYWSMK